MFLNLHHIRTAHERVDKVYAPGAFGPGTGDYGIVDPVKLGFDIYKDKDQYRLSGSVQTTLELPCSRCVEPFRLPVDSQFELRYQPQSQNTGDGEREVRDDELSSAFYENDQIDLELLMREQLELALPMKPLCTAECLGLCPSCGINLNRETCDCKREWEDPRFAALKAFQKRDS
jgi:uncharacterized protein